MHALDFDDTHRMRRAGSGWLRRQTGAGWSGRSERRQRRDGSGWSSRAARTARTSRPGRSPRPARPARTSRPTRSRRPSGPGGSGGSGRSGRSSRRGRSSRHNAADRQRARHRRLLERRNVDCGLLHGIRRQSAGDIGERRQLRGRRRNGRDLREAVMRRHVRSGGHASHIHLIARRHPAVAAVRHLVDPADRGERHVKADRHQLLG